MPQIDVPFLPGDKVRSRATGREIEVAVCGLTGDGWRLFDSLGAAFSIADVEAVKPVIKWERDEAHLCCSAGDWAAYDNGQLYYCNAFIDTFPDPRAVAEETQRLWNERAKGEA